LTKLTTKILLAAVSGALILMLQGFHNYYDEIKEYRASVGYLVKMTGCGKARRPCFTAISSIHIAQIQETTKLQSSSSKSCFSNGADLSFRQYTTVYSKTDYYRLAAKHLPLWGFKETEEAFKRANRVSGFGKPLLQSIVVGWINNTGEVFFDQHGSLNTLIRFVLFALRVCFFVSVYYLLHCLLLLPLLRKFAHTAQRDNLLDCLRAIGSQTPPGDAATNAIILKAFVVTGVSSIIIGGTITMVVTFKDPVFKMSFDPFKADVKHTVSGDPNILKPSQFTFANRTTLNIHLGTSTLNMLQAWQPVKLDNHPPDFSKTVDLLDSINTSLTSIDRSIGVAPKENPSEYQAYTSARKQLDAIKSNLSAVKSDISNIKSDMNKIKSVMK